MNKEICSAEQGVVSAFFDASQSVAASSATTSTTVSSCEAELQPPAAKKAGRIVREAMADPLRYFQDLSYKTRSAMKEIQYLRAKKDPSDPEASIEVVSLYADVLCPRQSAVQVREGKFLHANFVADEVSRRTLVASQYPKDLPLFWQFVAEHKFDIIDVSASTTQYAPLRQGEECTYGGIMVRLLKKCQESLCHYCELYSVRDEEKKTVHEARRLIFTGWPSHSIIELPTLHSLVTELETRYSGNALVHCSAGMGRTGTLITAYFLKQRILHHQIDADHLGSCLVDLLVGLRRQRGSRFVESREQFSLLIRFGQDVLCAASNPTPLPNVQFERGDTVPIEESTTDRVDTAHHSHPVLSPTTAGVTIHLVSKTPVELLEAISKELSGYKVDCDMHAMCLRFGYGPAVIRALIDHSPSLRSIVGGGYHSVFDGYVQEYVGGLDFSCSPGKTAALLQRAERYFRELVLPNKEPLALPSGLSEETLITACLDRRPGICIGESHLDTAPKDFIIDHLPFFVAHGVTTLFVEHIPSDSLQDEIDHYLRLPSGAGMPAGLSLYLEYLSEGFLIGSRRRNFKDVIVAAKSAGISKIICLDTEETYTVGSNQRDGCVDRTKRVMAMNFNAAQLIDAHKGSGKFLIFAGSAHMATCNHVPGLSQITGCVSVVVQDAPSSMEAGVQRDVTIVDSDFRHSEEEREFHFDLVVKRVPVKK